MTCIVGCVYGGGVVIGGDSAGVSGWDLTVRGDEKVFRVGPFLMGFTTSFRMGQLLRYRLQAPEHPDGMDDVEFMATLFIDAVRACLKAGGWGVSKDGRDDGGTFLVGYRGGLYHVGDDYQVGVPSAGYAAVGCGHAYAIGSMHATTNRDRCPIKRVRGALEAAEAFSAGVRGPFTIHDSSSEPDARTPTEEPDR